MYFQLKDAYFYLKRIAYYATGELVPTRKELVLKLKELPVDLFLSTEILQSLESCEENKAKIVNNPDGYLLKLERFFRTTRL